MTAGQLSQELEVTERTIYRDITALSAAGVPVYSETGCNGGYALVESYRTQLTGLTEGEARALFMLNIPAPLAELGIGAELKTALLKLSASLPASRRGDEERVRQRFHLDAAWWRQAPGRTPHLQTLHEAVWRDCRLRIAYEPQFTFRLEQVVDPYALVAKAGVWHLVYARAERVRVLPVDRFLEVQLSAENFIRPANFDLVRFWTDWCKEYESLMSEYKVKVRVSPDFIGELPRSFGIQVTSGQLDAGGRVTLELSFESLEAARQRILGFGRGVEVLEPEPLRRSILDYAEQILDLYLPAGQN